MLNIKAYQRPLRLLDALVGRQAQDQFRLGSISLLAEERVEFVIPRVYVLWAADEKTWSCIPLSPINIGTRYQSQGGC